MAWEIRLSDEAKRQVKRLDKTIANRILDYLDYRIASSSQPRQLGIAMQGRFRGYWRYRVGDYRIICDIQDEIVTVLVLVIGHRKDIYD